MHLQDKNHHQNQFSMLACTLDDDRDTHSPPNNRTSPYYFGGCISKEEEEKKEYYTIIKHWQLFPQPSVNYQPFVGTPCGAVL